MITSSSIRSLLALVFLACGGTVVESSGNGGGSRSGSTPSGVNGSAASPASSEWSCVNGMQSTLSTQRKVTYHLVRQNGTTPIADVQVKVCDFFDLNCGAPIGEELVSDAEGRFTVSFSRPVVLALTAPPPYVRGFIQPSTDAAAPSERSAFVSLVTSTELNIVAGTVGTTPQETLGTVLGLARSCQGKPADGMNFALSGADSQTVRYFLDEQGTPSTALNASSSFGLFGVLNLPGGLVRFDAYVPTLGKKVATYDLWVRAGAVTYVDVWPNL